jgi:hypothetical protein
MLFYLYSFSSIHFLLFIFFYTFHLCIHVYTFLLNNSDSDFYILCTLNDLMINILYIFCNMFFHMFYTLYIHCYQSFHIDDTKPSYMFYYIVFIIFLFYHYYTLQYLLYITIFYDTNFISPL